MSSKIRVMIIDDSAMVRQMLTSTLESDPDIRVIATASDPYVAVQRLSEEVPDVIMLDVEMPRMDGITFLKKLMRQHPVPVVICSSLAARGSETVLQALENGAVDIIKKPTLGVMQFFEDERVRLIDAVRGASVARVRRITASKDHAENLTKEVAPKHSADVIMSAPGQRAMARTTESVVVVGASTGGTEALREFLEVLPHDTPGIVIVQHMPEKFTTSFAARLNQLCRVDVREAVDGDTVLRGLALIAPGNKHMLLKRSGARYFVEVRDGELVNRHRPSVDVLFRSAATYAGKNAIGVILTGMGDDGARGMKEMYDAGARTIAQDEATSVVFGMPKEAIAMGGVQQILPLGQIAFAMMRMDSEEKLNG